MMLDKLKINQPRWKELSSIEEIYDFVDNVGFPVLIRPSYVLSGAAMNVVSNRDELEHSLNACHQGSKQYPVVVTEFIERAKEVEIDAVAQKWRNISLCISEHVNLPASIRAMQQWSPSTTVIFRNHPQNQESFKGNCKRTNISAF